MKVDIKELQNLPVFPFAQEFPYLSNEEEKELAQDLEMSGQHHPIILWISPTDGLTYLLDGRNRIKAFSRTNLFEAEVGYFYGTEFQAVEKVRALNILRRHLTVGQRSMAALAYLPYEEAEARKRQEASRAKPGERIGDAQVEPDPALPEEVPQKSGKARDIVAEKFNLSGQRISEAKKIAINAPDLAEEVRAGEISLDGAVKQFKKRNEARDKKVRELEFEAGDLYKAYFNGKMTLDDAYIALINRQKEEARRIRENNNEAISLIIAFNRTADERLREFNLKIQKLTTVDKVEEALGHLESIEEFINTTKSALYRLQTVLEERKNNN